MYILKSLGVLSISIVFFIVKFCCASDRDVLNKKYEFSLSHIFRKLIGVTLKHLYNVHINSPYISGLFQVQTVL